MENLIIDIAEKKVFDVNQIRADFPILNRFVHGKKIIYFDNAATTQKPKQVIDTIQKYYTNLNSNIHRGVHYLSEAATKEYECARKIIQNFINAKHLEEIIYTKGTTESINLVASSYGLTNFREGDEIIISTMEHHSNIVPWQIICQLTGAKLKVVPINENGEIIIDEFDNLLNEKTKFVSIVHVSNSLGTINPIKYIIDKSHKFNIPVLVDAAQSIQHLKIDVQDLDCDFLAFSGHKIYGPTGIGILYGKKKHLIEMPPYQGGGDMIMSVSFEKTIYNELPYKFEAGTPNIEGVIGLGVAIRYINNIGIDVIADYEKELLDYATQKLEPMKELKIIGTASQKASVISFIVDNAHPHDVGTILDREGIAIRTGHHCTEPVMKRFKVPATSRASFSFYNTFEEIDVLAKSLNKVINLFN